MATRRKSTTTAVLNPRERFKNKKKAKSFQSPNAVVSIDFADKELFATENRKNTPGKERKSNTPPPSRQYLARSRSTADIHYLLHNAVLTEDEETLERVLDESVMEEKKLNLNHKSTDGMTALHEGCYIGNVNCVRMLVEAGALMFVKTKEGQSPLQLAVTAGNFEVAEYLLSKGCQQDEVKDGVQV